ncbi:acyltransferase family protein [Escherichia coli]|nr:acyltransferase family protein [Escherichia coli]
MNNSALTGQGWVNLGYIVGDPLMLNFAVGCLIGLAYSELKISNSVNFYVFLFSFVILIYYALCVVDNISFFKLGIPSFLIITLAALSKPAEGRLYNILYLLGGSSYSIYLSHLYFVKYTKEYLVNSNFNNFTIYSILLISFCISLVFGVAFFKFVEFPIGKWLNRKINPVSKPVADNQ